MNDKSEKPDDRPYTWWDDVKYGLGAPLILLSVPILILLCLFGLFA